MYRDVLHGAGVIEVLMCALTDAAVISDLVLMQVMGSEVKEEQYCIVYV